MNHGFRLMGLL
ncbi:hypothetical protein F7R14_07400 [Pseudomonas lini]|uniref:Uncharacterized protein n=1 Tax=Pseudomonas lini TaxID=163011 RepID=A0A7V7P6M1_9PSED|nr:hypothetical protein F7R14_07400 [Pseudomonas lini]MDT9677583.1 hypothetical protein [Pseudomonas sp. JV414]